MFSSGGASNIFNLVFVQKVEKGSNSAQQRCSSASHSLEDLLKGNTT